MLEICFGDSVKGSLILAQNCHRSIGGVVSVITDKKGLSGFFAKRKALKEYRQKQAQLDKAALPLGGRREDIVSISFGLSTGDIKAPICAGACPRKDYIHDIFSFDRSERDDIEKETDAFWSGCIDDLHKIEDDPDKVRIWLDATPDARCGLLFVADIFKGKHTEISVVELPKSVNHSDNTIVEYRGWGEVEPQLFGSFLDRERTLSMAEIDDLSALWRKLQAENAPLRVVENGQVKSADISYYDDLIEKEFPESSCKVANIIGNALGRQKIPTGDIFIARRIKHFIESGRLIMTERSPEGFYHSVVARA